MKKISIVIPTHNEEENIRIIVDRIRSIFEEGNMHFDYNILFVDNASTDASRKIIRELARNDKHISYIFYVRNFGFSKSTFYGLTQADGDCAILLFADMQDPPELIEQFIFRWENGAKVVAGIKRESKESRIMFYFRKLFYKFMDMFSEIEHIEQFTGFGLYDRSVLDIFKQIDDPIPYLRGIVVELAPCVEKIEYTQNKRIYGKSSFKLKNLYEVAMLGITSYSRVFARFAALGGCIIMCGTLLISLITLFMKILNVIDYPVGNAAILIGVYFFGGLSVFLLGVIGEYVANINIRTMNHPIVVEEERYNI